MLYWQFSEKTLSDKKITTFQDLLKLFKELLMYSSGDVDQALSWLTELDRQHNITTPEYGVANFIADLKRKGFIEKKKKGDDTFTPSSKMESLLRKKALEDIFGDVKRSRKGEHSTRSAGSGNADDGGLRPYEYGDRTKDMDLQETLKNAYINHGIDQFRIAQDDIVVADKLQDSRMGTVLMIDISHSMILYGEDRITPAKKMAMALAELINIKYPKDKLDIVVFGNDAWRVEVKELPYLNVGPYHTNTVAGLELALELLRKQKLENKQVIMITDGKPTCIKRGRGYYKNSFGLDKRIVNRTMDLANKFRRLRIPITTFMIARDPYLVQFVEDFTAANNGRAYYSSLDELGRLVINDFNKGRHRLL